VTQRIFEKLYNFLFKVWGLDGAKLTKSLVTVP
jgi:hypothetical protein